MGVCEDSERSDFGPLCVALISLWVPIPLPASASPPDGRPNPKRRREERKKKKGAQRERKGKSSLFSFASVRRFLPLPSVGNPPKGGEGGAPRPERKGNGGGEGGLAGRGRMDEVGGSSPLLSARRWAPDARGRVARPEAQPPPPQCKEHIIKSRKKEEKRH